MNIPIGYGGSSARKVKQTNYKPIYHSPTTSVIENMFSPIILGAVVIILLLVKK